MKKQAKKLRLKKWAWFFGIFTAVVLGMITGVILANQVQYQIKIKRFPRLELQLSDVTLKEIHSGSKEAKYLVNEVKLVLDDDALSLGTAEIKGRGNTTWGRKKRPYQIKLDQKADIFGLGARKKWILLANSYDGSVGLRNDFALKLATTLGAEYSKMGEFVELFVDGEYVGLYYLLPKIEIAKNSVDLRGEKGVLVELDSLHFWDETVYNSSNGTPFVFQDAVYEDDDEKFSEARREFLERFSTFEIAAKKGDYTAVESLIDVKSFIIYYLVNEFAVNPDAYSTSFYFYTDGGEDKIHAGPVWDFDFAFGNRLWSWATEEAFYSPYETRIRENEAKIDKAISSIFYDLMKIPEFDQEVSRYYREKMSNQKDVLIDYFDERAKLIKKATEMDYAEYTNLYEKDPPESTKELRNWILNRFSYFETVYGNDHFVTP